MAVMTECFWLMISSTQLPDRKAHCMSNLETTCVPRSLFSFISVQLFQKN